MTRHFLAGIASLAIAHSAAAQDIVPPKPNAADFYQLQSQVVFQGPTLVVLVPLPEGIDPLGDSPETQKWRNSVMPVIDSARMVAGNFGFAVVVRDPLYASLAARKGDAFYAAPRNVTTGYILVTPLKHARLQKGYLTAAGLADLLRDYQTAGRPLAL